jgi:hypothetical protein
MRTEPLPLYLVAHGIVFIAWFLLLFTQSILAVRGSMVAHRLLGLLGGGLAAVMAVSALFTLYSGVGSIVARGATVYNAGQFFFGNLSLLVPFACFVILGFRNRYRQETHMRLMLLASLAIIGQSTNRIIGFEFFDRWGVESTAETFLTLGALAALLATLAVHDRLILGHIHRVVKWGAPALFVSLVLGGVIVPGIPIAQKLMILLYW